jgi:hypothetical protein
MAVHAMASAPGCICLLSAYNRRHARPHLPTPQRQDPAKHLAQSSMSAQATSRHCHHIYSYCYSSGASTLWHSASQRLLTCGMVTDWQPWQQSLAMPARSPAAGCLGMHSKLPSHALFTSWLGALAGHAAQNEEPAKHAATVSQ